MLNSLCFLYGTKHLSTSNLRPRLESRHEMEAVLTVERGDVYPARDKLVGAVADGFEGALYAVIDGSDETGAELD